MITCQYCRMDTAGNHELNCPMNSKKIDGIEEFVKEVANIHKIQLIDSDEELINKYTSLLSSYCMTLDMIDVASEIFDVQKLHTVADFIVNTLDRCINEIIAIQELRDNEK